METYEFSIIASGIDPEAEDFEDRFFEAGCDDATIAFQRGMLIIDFARESKSFMHAVYSAVRDVLKTGAKVERIEPDPLVSLSEIAKRTGLTRAAITQYALGHRGEGFPTPIARVTTDSPLWDWVEVARWMYHSQKAKMGIGGVVRARVVKDCNLLIAGRHEEPPRALRRKQRELEAA
jgi:hypothetical protein